MLTMFFVKKPEIFSATIPFLWRNRSWN